MEEGRGRAVAVTKELTSVDFGGFGSNTRIKQSNTWWLFLRLTLVF